MLEIGANLILDKTKTYLFHLHFQTEEQIRKKSELWTVIYLKHSLLFTEEYKH